MRNMQYGTDTSASPARLVHDPLMRQETRSPGPVSSGGYQLDQRNHGSVSEFQHGTERSEAPTADPRSLWD